MLQANAPAATVMSFSYCYNQAGCTGSPSSVVNNGDLVKMVNNRDANRSQNFTYDGLNRVASASTDGTNWGSTYTVDAWGNLTNKTPMQGKLAGENLQQAAGENNRLVGFSYDASGNLLSDGTSSYTYDAENRIRTAAGVTYTYDGNGERVAKSTGVLYWGGSAKDALDESDASGNLTHEYVFFNGKRCARLDLATGAVFYYFSDHLGSSNVITDASGNIKGESDFYPYGGEVVVVADSTANHYKFTGKERDPETGVDYFFARYYSSALGRFLTPDWSATPVPVPYASLGDPQSLNLYSYVENNPITGIDPDGHLTSAPFAMYDSPYGNAYDTLYLGASDPTDADYMQQWQKDAQQQQAVAATTATAEAETAAAQTATTAASTSSATASTTTVTTAAEAAAGTAATGAAISPLGWSILVLGGGYIIIESFAARIQSEADSQMQDHAAANDVAARKSQPLNAKEHTKGARPSTRGKHQKGRGRRKRDRGGEKGDKRPPRKRPPNWKGPWPPDPHTVWW